MSRGITKLLGSVLLATTALWGQSAHVSGRVTDPTGAVVPAATIQLINIDTGITRLSETNLQGEYLVPLLRPGRYEANLRAEGFVPITRSGIALRVGGHLRLDFVLQVGPVETAIRIEIASSEIQFSTSEVGSVISERQVVDLPLNGRNFTQLTLLTPGASPVNTSQNASGAGTTGIGQVSVPSVNGQTGRSNVYLADGTLNQNGFLSTYAVAPIVDAIQEFKVQSHNDLAEYGQANGAIVNVISKSGTNEWHGSAWWFHRNDDLDARNFFRPTVTPLAQNQFGATAGGPIIRDRTFVFGAFQGFRKRTPADHLYRVPTRANLRGDMSDWPTQIYDPFSGRAAPSEPGQLVRDPFPNNRIPESRLDPGFLEYARLTLPEPIPVGIGDFNQLDATPSAVDQNEYSARVDHHHSPKDTFWGRWAMQRADSNGSGGRQSLVSRADFESHILGGTGGRQQNIRYFPGSLPAAL